MADGRILVGVIGAPHGVRGEVRLKSYTAEPLAVAGYKTLWAGEGGRPLVVAGARLLKDDMLVVRFEAVATREAAQALTNLPLFVQRDDLPAPAEDEFYHADLIGLAALRLDGTPVGRVVSLANFGAGDMLDIASDGGDSFYVPFTRAFVPTVDLAGGRVILSDAAIAAAAADDAEEG